MESKTEFTLNPLDKLSHEAIESAFYDHPDLILSRIQIQGAIMNNISVWQRLFFLIEQTEHVKSGLLGLKRLLQGSKTPAWDDEIVEATLIFLKFKKDGDYSSVDGDGNTCLHDAALVCDIFWPALTRLLIKHGATFGAKNSKRNTAPMAAIVVKSTAFRDNPELLDLYDWKKHYETLLLSVAMFQSSEMMQFMIDKGANDEQPVHVTTKLIHRLIRNIFSDCYPSYPSDLQRTNLAMLFLAVLKQGVAKDEEIKAPQVINFLFELDLNSISRENLYEKVRLLNDKQLSRDNREYCNYYQSKSTEVEHDEIKIQGKIGEGIYAIVYKGINTPCQNQEVAVKMNQRKFNNDMRKEAALLSQLKHPNIISYISSLERKDDFGNIIFGFVMPYARQTLSNFITTNLAQTVQDSLPWIVKAITAGLRYLHSQGLVHRDLKPMNILMHGAQLWLADFGVTRPKGYLSKENRTTISYAAPENFCYKQPIDFPSDIYSLGGGIIPEMVTQTIPWGNQKDAVIQESVCKGMRPTFGNKTMSQTIAPLVTWCWNQDPAKRPTLDEIDDYIDKTFKPATP